ncbi:uncharacterized protein LOC101513303 [Anopheles sinensis]|uniref:Uncharacterized protein LOC101513303 n=1 Tax=Anopheles sinensis TaxID=74873 RepID=A0A084W2Q0_ANOSI|nr:uncharacterized protein LOC101513303 [Anopheles sinensis]
MQLLPPRVTRETLCSWLWKTTLSSGGPLRRVYWKHQFDGVLIDFDPIFNTRSPPGGPV